MKESVGPELFFSSICFLSVFNYPMNVYSCMHDLISAIVISGTKTVKPNEQIKLTCNASSSRRDPVTSLEWYKNGRKLQEDRRNLILRNYGRDAYYVSELYVRRTRVEDGGRYTCRSQRNQESIDVRIEGK